jgi:hypothetical protein
MKTKTKAKKRKKAGKKSASAQRAVAEARAAVTRAGQKLDDRLAGLQRVADGLEQAAVERFQDAAVGELRDDQLLRDLTGLQAALAAMTEGGGADTIEAFRHLPEALLRWLQAHFGLKPYLEAGKVLQVPSDKLDGFSLTRDRGDAPTGVLVRIKVVAPGWKRNGEVVVAPRAELIGG